MNRIDASTSAVDGIRCSAGFRTAMMLLGFPSGSSLITSRVHSSRTVPPRIPRDRPHEHPEACVDQGEGDGAEDAGHKPPATTSVRSVFGAVPSDPSAPTTTL